MRTRFANIFAALRWLLVLGLVVFLAASCLGGDDDDDEISIEAGDDEADEKEDEAEEEEDDEVTTTTTTTPTTTLPPKPPQLIQFTGPREQIETIEDVLVEISEWPDPIVADAISVSTGEPTEVEVLSETCELGDRGVLLANPIVAGTFCEVQLTAEATGDHAETVIVVRAAIVAAQEQYWTARGPVDGACYDSLQAIPDLVVEAAPDDGDQKNSVEWVAAGVFQNDVVRSTETLSQDARTKVIRFVLANQQAAEPDELGIILAFSIPSTGISGGTPPKEYQLQLGGC